MRLGSVFFLIYILLLSSFAYSYSAMGVTPSSRKDIYIGQEEINGQFTVLPDGEKNLRIYSVSEIGDGEFVVFENNRTTIDIHANGPTQVTYSFRPPKNLKPGTYETHIVISQFYTEGEIRAAGGFASALAAVGYVIFLRVPNEGKFLEAAMSINPSKIRIGEIVHFTVDLLNFGTEDLINLNTNIDIKGPNGDVLESNPTTTISLLTPGSRDQLKSYWKSDGYPAGEYSAEAKIDYGGTYLAEPKIKIRVGDILINILNVTTQLNESIGKVFISVESNWNDLIKDVYAEIIIRNGSKVIDRIKTSSINMEPWSRKILTAFWERRALPAGEYELETIVYYEDKQSNKIIKVDLPELTDLPSPAKIDSVLLIVVVSFLVLILIINLVWFFFNLKEKKQGKKRNKK